LNKKVPQCPSDYVTVISVGSVSDKKEWSAFSSGKCMASIGASGENILFTFNGKVVVNGLLYKFYHRVVILYL
jgi:hypothetical protein